MCCRQRSRSSRSWFLVVLLPVLGACHKSIDVGDEAAIRAALAAGRATILLPARVIDISSGLIFPDGASNVEIRGAGPLSVLRMTAGFRGRAAFCSRSGSRIRFQDFTVDGNRDSLERPSGLPPSDVAFARFSQASGILVERAINVEIKRVHFRNIVSFPILVSASKGTHIEGVFVENSGSKNAAGRNNTTGGILLEEGATDFQVLGCELKNILGNGIWTHSLYTSPRNANGLIARNRLDGIGRDALQVGHATNVRVERNLTRNIGYPTPIVDLENRAIPVGIDTAGNTDRSAYVENRIEEVNGKCIDLDGFHHGDVRANICVNAKPAREYPFGNYGIVMNNSNPDMQSEAITISDNEIDGVLFGGIFVIGSRNTIVRNRLRNMNQAHCNEEAGKFGCYYSAGEPDMLRSGIYLGRGAERPAPARGNIVEDNEISGFKMDTRCIGVAPGVSLAENRVARNKCE